MSWSPSFGWGACCCAAMEGRGNLKTVLTGAGAAFSLPKCCSSCRDQLAASLSLAAREPWASSGSLQIRSRICIKKRCPTWTPPGSISVTSGSSAQCCQSSPQEVVIYTSQDYLSFSHAQEVWKDVEDQEKLLRCFNTWWTQWISCKRMEWGGGCRISEKFINKIKTFWKKITITLSLHIPSGGN